MSAQASATLTPKRLVARANLHVDPPTDLNLARELPTSDLRGFPLRFTTGSQLARGDLEWMVGCVRRSLKRLYEESEMGWDECAKRRELRHAGQRFVVVERPGEARERLAFLSYRWDVEEEEGRAVMYVYEVFVEEQVRGRGVGVGLMRYAEEMCSGAGVGCLVLTVFQGNRGAMRLYRDKLGYSVDPSSPSRYGYNDVGYEILSKDVCPPPPDPPVPTSVKIFPTLC